MQSAALPSPRKLPRQQRAQVTVDAILEAAAQVLVQEGWTRTTTNRIAARAGVSVGSLYQYFPSKEAIIVRLAERHIGHALELLARVVRELSGAPVEVVVQTYVRAMLQAHAVEPELHRVLTEQIPRIAGLHWVHTLHQEAEALVAGWIEAHRRELRPVDPKLAGFVLVSAVEAVTHKAVLDRQDLFQSDALADELVALVLAYLRPLPMTH